MNDATIPNTANPYFPEFVEPAEKIVANTNAWLKDYKDKGITDEEAARRCDDFVGQVKAHIAKVEAARKKQKDPIIAEGKLIDGHADRIKRPLEIALTLLEGLRRGWLQLLRQKQQEETNRKAEAARKATAEAEAARKAAEKATTVEAQVAAEQAAETAAQAMTDLNAALTAKPQVKGDFVQRATGLRTIWSGRIDNLELAVLHYIKQPVGKAKITEVVQQLANADARAVKAADIGVPGVAGIEEER